MSEGLADISPPISDSACWNTSLLFKKEIDGQDFQKLLVIPSGLGLSMGFQVNLPDGAKQ